VELAGLPRRFRAAAVPIGAVPTRHESDGRSARARVAIWRLLRTAPDPLCRPADSDVVAHGAPERGDGKTDADVLAGATSHGLGLVCFAVAAGASQSGRGSGAARTGNRRVLVQRQVGPRFFVIRTVARHQLPHARFVERDHVIETLAPCRTLSCAKTGPIALRGLVELEHAAEPGTVRDRRAGYLARPHDFQSISACRRGRRKAVV
jgi:hypothetical protein